MRQQSEAAREASRKIDRAIQESRAERLARAPRRRLGPIFWVGGGTVTGTLLAAILVMVKGSHPGVAALGALLGAFAGSMAWLGGRLSPAPADDADDGSDAVDDLTPGAESGGADEGGPSISAGG